MTLSKEIKGRNYIQNRSSNPNPEIQNQFRNTNPEIIYEIEFRQSKIEKKKLPGVKRNQRKKLYTKSTIYKHKLTWGYRDQKLTSTDELMAAEHKHMLFICQNCGRGDVQREGERDAKGYGDIKGWWWQR